MEVVHLPEATYHFHVKRLKQVAHYTQIEQLICAIFKEHKARYGYRRIQLELRNQGYQVNHKKVQRIMKQFGLKAKTVRNKYGKYSSYKGKVGRIAKNKLHRKFFTSIAHQKLTTDITEFKCKSGKKLYLSPVLDMYNGEILSYTMQEKPTFSLVMDSLNSSLQKVKGSPYRTTMHSDQGWHYQQAIWRKTLKKNKLFQSMSRKGNCLDNSPMENFFGLLKQEMYYGEPLRTYRQLEQAIKKYIHYYNNKRIKKKLAGLSPVQYRLQSAN